MKWTVAPGSRLWLEGTSTLHPYRVEARRLEVLLETSGDAFDAQARFERLEVTVPLAALQSGDSLLDSKLKDTLKRDVTFAMERCEVSGTGAAFGATVWGQLAVARARRAIDLRVRCEAGPRITGQKTLQMTHFGITPPTMLFLLKVHDPVTVHFDLRLQP